MTAGRWVMLAIGALFALTGLAIAATGGAGLWLDATAKDADGFLESPTFELDTDGYALTGEELVLAASPGDWTGWFGRVDLRLSATAADGSEVFLGIGPEGEVDRYLDGVAHDRVRTLGDGPEATRSDRVGGDEVPAPPADQQLWSARVLGPGTQTLTWEAEAGRWSVVVMNADASPGVAVTADAGIRTDLLVPIAIALLIVGLLLVGAAAVLVLLAVRQPTAAAAVTEPATVATPYPLALRGRLDPTVSRWQWLVKWLLLLPHIIVLALLWTVFVVLTFAAGVAILVTGRYPRGLFDLNVGILRWTWRVTFYGYGVLGTDRYPPFSLDRRDHPAELEVVYPERLSRGLVLVKWWLLVLPHYLVVAVLTGGAMSWTFGTGADESWRLSLGGGLIGLLVLIAGVVLLFRAHYPQGLFDVVMGFNRWVYRVIVYAALMTDVYPPFRLDAGGEEPPVPPPPPATGPSDPTRRQAEPVG
jgi:hypothetical protein